MVKAHHIIASSVRGHSHVLKGIPNQDAYGIVQTEDIQLALIADGHGSKTCFRSQKGAEFAVEEARDVILEGLHLGSTELLHDPQKLFKTLLKRWAIRILKDLKAVPFHPDEIALLNPIQKKTIGKNALVAYGTTLNMVLLFKGKVYVWKVGDGAIIIREDMTSPVKEILDRHWFGVETLSLSTCNPVKDVDFVILSGQPKEILMCSDGYKNAFRSDLDFYKALQDFSSLYETKPAGYVEGQIEAWLNETSRMGSGDDITLILFLPEVVS